MKRNIVLIVVMLLFLNSAVYAKSFFPASFDELKQNLVSDTYNAKKKSLMMQIYFKRNKKINKEHIFFFTEYLSNPEKCSSNELFKIIAKLLYDNSNHEEFLNSLKKLITNNLNNIDYVIYCLNFYIENYSGDINRTDKAYMKKMGKESERKTEYLLSFSEKSDYKIFTAAIKQNTSVATYFSMVQITNLKKFTKVIMEEIKKSNNYNLILYFTQNKFTYDLIQNSQCIIFIDIVENSSLPNNVRKLASFILFKTYFMNPKKNFNWRKWYAENNKTFNRIDAAKKAVLNLELNSDTKFIALRYLDCRVPIPEFIKNAMIVLKSTKDSDLCGYIYRVFTHYKRKFPKDLKIAEGYKVSLKKYNYLLSLKADSK